jgi:hypothetical protein
MRNEYVFEYAKDQVTVKSTDGSQSATYMTHVGSKGGHHVATIFDANFIGQEGWILCRALPGGREEAYLILEANYSPGLNSIPPPIGA